MEINLDEKIRIEKLKFISNIQNKDIDEKKLYHFYSVLNLSNSIIKYNDDSSNSSKKLIIDYFKKINDLKGYSIDKEQSIALFKEYLLPVGHLLIKKTGFITKASIFINITLGVILDILIFGIIFKQFYVVFTFIFIFFGILKRKKKIKENKFFSINW